MEKVEVQKKKETKDMAKTPAKKQGPAAFSWEPAPDFYKAACTRTKTEDKASPIGAECYKGEILNGKHDGQGELTNVDDVVGDVYVGYFKDGEFEGRGRFTYADGSLYEGDFKAGGFHGTG